MIIEPSEHSENPKIQIRPRDNWILLNFFYFHTNLKHIEEFSDRSLTGRGQHISPSADMKNSIKFSCSKSISLRLPKLRKNVCKFDVSASAESLECLRMLQEWTSSLIPSFFSVLLPFRLPVPKGHHCLPIIQGSRCQGQGRPLFRPRELFSKFLIFSPFLALFKILNFSHDLDPGFLIFTATNHETDVPGSS